PVAEERRRPPPPAGRRRTRAVARRDAPDVLAIVAKAPRIPHRVLLVHVCRAAAVFKVVDGVPPHEGILYAAEVDPQMRELVHEQRRAVEKFVTVQTPPAIG